MRTGPVYQYPEGVRRRAVRWRADTIQPMRRRSFLIAATGLAGCGPSLMPPDPERGCPAFLEGFEAQYAVSPRTASRDWFRAAGTGLAIQYGVYSQLGRGPRAQFDEVIPLERYSALRQTFEPAGFDAEEITATAVAAHMGYVVMTARHADGFCLFRTVQTDFNSLESGGRDLVAELARACRHRGLGLFLAYSYAADWRHPYFYSPETSRIAGYRSRPAYEPTPEEYRFRKDEDFLLYVQHVHRQLEEIVYRYEPLVGVRLEPAAGYYARPDLFPVAQTYSILRQAQPWMLISFGQGVSGDEDFVTEPTLDGSHPLGGEIAERVRLANRGKPRELRAHLRAGKAVAGSSDEASLGSARDLLDQYGRVSNESANLLASVSLRPDGSLDPADARALREFGRLVRM